MIRLEEIHKHFGHNHVLRGVSLGVDKGEVVCIIGPSGSGKTTLLSIMGCIFRPSSGRVYVNGCNATALSEHQLPALRARSFGFVFQQFFLIASLTALVERRLASSRTTFTSRTSSSSLTCTMSPPQPLLRGR